MVEASKEIAPPRGVLEPPFGRFLRLMRKSGISLLAITHTPQDLGEYAPIFLEGAGILVMFASADASYLRFCKENLHMVVYELEEMKMMRPVAGDSDPDIGTCYP